MSPRRGRHGSRPNRSPPSESVTIRHQKGVTHLKTHTEYLWFITPRRHDYLNITDEVARIVAASGIIADIEEWLEQLAPARPDYKHHRTGEDNADAHLKSLLIHHEIIVPITNGELDFGPWQQVYYAEFDGQRRKRVVVKVMGE